MGTPESRPRCLLQRGQGNFELITNFDYIHEGQRTLAKVYVGAGSQSFPEPPTKCCSNQRGLLSGWVLAGMKETDSFLRDTENYRFLNYVSNGSNGVLWLKAGKI